MIISVVPREYIPRAWRKAGPLLDRAIKYADDRFDSFSIFEGCVTGEYQLWVVTEEDDVDDIMATFTSKIIEYPKRRGLAVHWVAGEKGKLHKWYPKALNVLEKFAKDMGCSHLEAHGREEWVGQHSRHGWKKKYVTCEKELDNG